MSDIFISELLVAALLLPVLIRPFFQHLQRVYALAILPFIAFFVCIFVLIGQGIFLSFALLTVLTLIVCCSELGRVTALFQQMRNDFYGTASAIVRVVLLFLFGAYLFFLFRFMPVPPYKITGELTVTPLFSDSKIETPVQARLISSTSATTAEHNDVLVILASPLFGSNGLGTPARVIADKGYSVIELTQQSGTGFLPRFELYERLLPLIGKKQGRYLKKVSDESDTAAGFIIVLKKIAEKYGKTKQLFVYADGIYTDVIARYALNHPDIFSGVFFSFSEEEPLPSTPAGWAASGTTGILKTDAERFAPFYFFVQPYQNLTGFSSLASDDPFTSLLLGVSDEGMKQSRQAEIKAADLFCKWLTQKRIFQ